MGYLGGHPYTTTTAQKVIDFDAGNPPPPAPTRRAQYSYMAVSLDKPIAIVSKKDSVATRKNDSNSKYEKVADSEMVEEYKEKKNSEPKLGDEVLNNPTPPASIDYVDLNNI